MPCSYSEQEEEVILTDRNNHWMEQLPGMMAKESCFVAVGAGHLIGETGLLTRFEQLGYTVEPVK